MGCPQVDHVAVRKLHARNIGLQIRFIMETPAADVFRFYHPIWDDGVLAFIVNELSFV